MLTRLKLHFRKGLPYFIDNPSRIFSSGPTENQAELLAKALEGLPESPVAVKSLLKCITHTVKKSERDAQISKVSGKMRLIERRIQTLPRKRHKRAMAKGCSNKTDYREVIKLPGPVAPIPVFKNPRKTMPHRATGINSTGWRIKLSACCGTGNPDIAQT